MDMNAAWLSGPIQLHSSRAFECDELTAGECDWYKQRWHFWYETIQAPGRQSGRLTNFHQVYCRLCFCIANGSILHVRHWHFHHWPCCIADSWISQISRTSGVEKADGKYSISIVSRLSCQVTALELGSGWHLIARACRYNLLFL